MCYKKLFLISLFLFLFGFQLVDAQAKEEVFPEAFAQNGNIYYSPDGKQNIQLTKSAKDRSPVLSPDGSKIVFIRKSDRKAYLAAGGEEEYSPKDLLADQVWIIGSNGKHEKLLVEDVNPDELQEKGVAKAIEKTIAHIDDKSLQFSPDGQQVYFITSAWATSGAVHAVNIVNADGPGEMFLMPGNSLEVIKQGEYKDHLIVRQHRYFVFGGSYDWLWLFTPDGKEVGPLGPERNQGQ